MEKRRLDRRLKQLEREGILFKPNSNIGVDITAIQLEKEFDAILLAIGALKPKDIALPGRKLEGVYFAMDYLTVQNKLNEGDTLSTEEIITGAKKRVIVIGGGDTGSDCVGTATRQGATSVTQLQIRSMPSKTRSDDNPWPQWPQTFSVSPSQEEAGIREFSVITKEFLGENNKVVAIRAARARTVKTSDGNSTIEEIPGSEYVIPADLVVIAIGYAGPQTRGLFADFALKLTPTGALSTNEQKMTSREGIFAAGDASRGQSLIVWAIAEGRNVADNIDNYLMKVN
jgi:glutamate synthase (NADPH) small chain